MSTVIITLEIRTHRTDSPEHSGKGGCLCDDCYWQYLAQAAERDGLTAA
jgi:hypothetical protein